MSNLKLTTRDQGGVTVLSCNGRVVFGDESSALRDTVKGLIAEVVDTVDHHADTVMKKAVYEDVRLPRLWMVDPRYDNVEVYHGSPYGLALQRILANRDLLTETLLPELSLGMVDLFAPESSPGLQKP